MSKSGQTRVNSRIIISESREETFFSLDLCLGVQEVSLEQVATILLPGEWSQRKESRAERGQRKTESQ